jgi:hypothetical protein
VSRFWEDFDRRVLRHPGGTFEGSWLLHGPHSMPHDVDPSWHTREDGLWQFRSMPLAYESV